jgi:hypothetical protein
MLSEQMMLFWTPTLQDAMIGRAKHYNVAADGTKTPDPVFVTNCEKVYEIIAKMTRDHSCWTYLKPAQKTRDGRMAYMALYLYFRGPNNVDNMATMAEDKLKSTVYNGEQRRWDFEKYINVHKSQHSIMEGLFEHGYTGIDPRFKVRNLLDGIKTDNFDSVKTRIISDATLRNDFDACVTLYQDFIKQTAKSKMTPTVGIYELKTSAGGTKRKSAAGVEDRYYTKASTMLYLPIRRRTWLPSASNMGTSPVPRTARPRRELSPKATPMPM